MPDTSTVSETSTSDSLGLPAEKFVGDGILAIARVPENLLEQPDKLDDSFSTLLDYVRPGGHVFVILPAVSSGEYTAETFRLVGRMENLGWRFQEDIVWDNRGEDSDRHPEYIFAFKNPADAESRNNIYWNRSEEEKENNEIDLSDYQGEMSKNVWKISTDDDSTLPKKLPKRIIQLYSYEGDTILDVFGSDGQIARAADEEERNCVIFDTVTTSE